MLPQELADLRHHVLMPPKKPIKSKSKGKLSSGDDPQNSQRSIGDFTPESSPARLPAESSLKLDDDKPDQAEMDAQNRSPAKPDQPANKGSPRK